MTTSLKLSRKMQYNAKETLMDIWEKMYERAKEQYHPDFVISNLMELIPIVEK